MANRNILIIYRRLFSSVRKKGTRKTLCNSYLLILKVRSGCLDLRQTNANTLKRWIYRHDESQLCLNFMTSLLQDIAIR
jgi:hypothetical protein